MSFNDAVTRLSGTTRPSALTPTRLIVGGILLAEAAWLLGVALLVVRVVH